MTLTVWLMPPGLEPAAATILPAVAGLGALVTTIAGAGGGLLLLAVMTVWLPPSAAIPLHGLIQGGANLGRSGLFWRSIRWRFVAAFAAGAAPGAMAGAYVFTHIPGHWIEVVLGLFILVAGWCPMPTMARTSSAYAAAGAAITNALTLFVGATGPMVAALLRPLGLERHVHMGTFSLCMTLQHGLKTLAFAGAGFAFGPYVPWLAVALACVLVGNWLGRRLLDRLPERWFARLVTAVLTVLALRLIVDGLAGVGF